VLSLFKGRVSGWVGGWVGGGNVILRLPAGNTKGGSITVPLTSCLNGLKSAV
jgi:hypothetical protein